jgi:four helix bundle protein
MEKKFEFEKLDVYQKAIEFNDNIYGVTKNYPKSELYGLISQFRRCSTSIALNIAEGYGRFHKKLKQQFYFTARASVYECIPILTISLNQNYINKSDHDKLYKQCLEISQMISGLIKSINERNTE